MTGWEVIAYSLAAIGGYMLGSVPFGLVLTRLAGLGDIREIGSKNIGATNVLRTGRKDLAAATLILDAAKAGIAALVFTALLGPVPGLVAGGAAFLGHCFPVWLGFKGGKGVATFYGTLFAVAWPVGILAALTWIGMALLVRISSLSALVAAAMAPLIAWLFDRPGVALLCLFLAALIFWRHRANIRRLMQGEEPRIGAKPA
ncbi:glycerol-3-phosphate 1-O-acyltransferase PlsY [Hyphobacterium sp.]|uniref:glycerol-3-phosphate 1-O-acyltransferase PlsY n=1 Tax=Hyphobacterium sp. TaxID=2004662 RepID=UPI003B52EB6C